MISAPPNIGIFGTFGKFGFFGSFEIEKVEKSPSAEHVILYKPRQCFKNTNITIMTNITIITIMSRFTGGTILKNMTFLHGQKQAKRVENIHRFNGVD